MQISKLRLVVEQIDLRRRAGLKQKNHPLPVTTVARRQQETSGFRAS
jgi:hypothetical protein